MKIRNLIEVEFTTDGKCLDFWWLMAFCASFLMIDVPRIIRCDIVPMGQCIWLKGWLKVNLSNEKDPDDACKNDKHDIRTSFKHSLTLI